MASNSDIFNQVRSAVDIVEVIGEHIALKRAGREFKGLCPFHEDHRPSMAVVPHKQIFHCFVCGTGGDVFKFVKEFHKMGNGEALRMLAQRAGIRLPDLPSGGGRGPEKDKDGLSPRERIAATNEWACDFFEKTLRTQTGKSGLDYFHARGLTEETIARFRLGFAPEGWTGMVNAGMRLGISNESLAEAGLIKRRADSSPYDAFRGRVIFPIVDATGGGASGKGGRVIAFGGRVLVEKKDEAGNVVEAKYLNSPDSRLFNKSESLYGLNHARQHIIRTRTAIVVEGYMDVIACHQAGVTNVVATLGTALTPEHARILKNYAQTIVLVFDSDDAGRRAADRALEVFVRGTLDVKITSVPDGKDPCDFCMKNGGEAFGKIVDEANDALTYKLNQLNAQFHGTDSVTGRQEAVMTFLRFVSPLFEARDGGGGGMGIADPVRRGILLSKIAGLVNMPVGELQGTLKKLASQAQTAYRPMAQSSAVAAPSPSVDDASAQWAAIENETLAVAVAAPINTKTLKGLDAAEGWLLGAFLVKPSLYASARNELSLSLFTRFGSLAAFLMEYFDNHGELEHCTLAELMSAIEDGELTRQAIELEEKTANWLDPAASLSPNHVRLLQQLSADRGLSLENLAEDSLRELCAGRRANAAVEADFGESAPVEIDALSSAMNEIAVIQMRNAAGGNRRVVGK